MIQQKRQQSNKERHIKRCAKSATSHHEAPSFIKLRPGVFVTISFLFVWMVVSLSKYKNLNREGACLSLVVPATSHAATTYFASLLKHMQATNTFLPDEIILVSPILPKNLPREISYHRLRHIYSREGSNAAENRNLGGSKAKCNLITFFDVDDLPHPDRFVVIWSLFRKHDELEAILFPFERAQVPKHFFKRVKYLDSKPICRPFAGSRCNSSSEYTSSDLHRACYLEHWNQSSSVPNVLCCREHSELMLANGWLSIKKSVFNRFKYNTTLSVAEDGELNARLIHAGIQLYSWDFKLGLYNIDHLPIKIE